MNLYFFNFKLKTLKIKKYLGDEKYKIFLLIESYLLREIVLRVRQVEMSEFVLKL